MRGKKEIVLVFLIIFSLVGLSLYTTYGLYTSMHENSENADYDLSLVFELSDNINNEIVVNQNSTKKIYLNISNPYDFNLSYKIYYLIMNEVSNDHLILKYADNINTEYLAPSQKLSVPILVTNNGETATIKILAKAGYQNKAINLDPNQYEISGEIRNITLPSIVANNEDNTLTRGLDDLLDNLFTIDYHDSNGGTTTCWANDITVNNISELDLGEYQIKCMVTNRANLKAIAITNLTITE